MFMYAHNKMGEMKVERNRGKKGRGFQIKQKYVQQHNGIRKDK